MALIQLDETAVRLALGCFFHNDANPLCRKVEPLGKYARGVTRGGPCIHELLAHFQNVGVALCRVILLFLGGLATSRARPALSLVLFLLNLMFGGHPLRPLANDFMLSAEML